MSSFTCARLTAWTIAAVLLQVVGLSLFVIGFFPVKPTLSGVSGSESYQMPTCDSTVQGGNRTVLPPDHQLRSLYEEMSEIPPSFDRLILMVVDGLPAEFVLGKGDQPPSNKMMEAMPYTQSLLSNGKAVGYHAKAAPPTVTMPRLKAMVSGAIGGFLDVAFNFNTQAFLDDNLLGQFYMIGWRMVMLGDETWIKLFPRLFKRQDGVSSFYVKDTLEVDYNVSRHLEVELAACDWNLLILHYLGLDHVGHIGGRYSTLMAPKLKEMDEVIKKIHLSSILHQNDPEKRTLLLVVSDHGMTDNGNHGGSSYEETDSLALFIGMQSKVPDYALTTRNDALQVDIAPTLALLFGVPIPKNNIGVLISGVLDSLTDKQKLRALELNSWQILRLLHAQLPGLLCANSPCNSSHCEHGMAVSKCTGSIAAKFCCLFARAAAFHSSWKSQSNSTDDLQTIITAYYDFLRTSTEWLSQKATDKPFSLFASGIAIILISSMILLGLLYRLCKEVHLRLHSGLIGRSGKWHLDEVFVFIVVLIHVISLISSSMVEEEQYTWHFLTSTLFFVFLRMSLQSFPAGSSSDFFHTEKGHKYFIACQSVRNSGSHDSHFKICSVIVVLLCGRILRGWHQGGVNWTHLPDISKWLNHAGILCIKSLQIASVLLVVSFGSFNIYRVKSMRSLSVVVQIVVWISALLVLCHAVVYENHAALTSTNSTDSIAQVIYATSGLTVMGTALISPWIMPIPNRRTHNAKPDLSSLPIDMTIQSVAEGIRDSSYLSGGTYITCWCLLQLLLQQPVNAMPILLLQLQILSSMTYFSAGRLHHRQWVEVASMYFLGMAGHFGLGNSNALATIDVAGAFIGISSYSTVLAGILLFAITFASPLLFLLANIMYTPMMEMKYLLASCDADLGCHLQMMIGIPCLLPLVLNSIVLTTFTIVLLFMRNHLFVWSVFSPKYLYVSAATVSVYIGVSVIAATGIYTRAVLFLRTKIFISNF